MFYFFPFPGFRNPVFLLIIPFTLTGGIYREKLRRKYNCDIARFGSLQHVQISATEFGSGLLSCCYGHKAVKKTIFSCLCAPVRLAANSSAVGFMDYWSVIIVGSFFLPLIFILGYIQRLHIRNLYSMNPHPVADFFAWMCCCGCALMQEVKLLDLGFAAQRSGTSVVILPDQSRPRLDFEYPQTESV